MSDGSATTSSRTWIDAPNRVDRRYQRAYGTRGGTKGTTGLDLYFAREPVDRPLIVFHHIQKTAGTSLRNVLHSNYKDAEFEIRSIEVEDERRELLRQWYAELWDSLGEKRERLICAAGHYAAFLLPVVEDRPIEAFTLLRDPVDRVISRYYFYNRERSWSLQDLYERSEWDVLRGVTFERGRFRAFYNGASRSILQPFYATEAMPLTTEEPGCDLWRKRLFGLMDEHFVVGVQERFVESLELLGERFGWKDLYPATARVNKGRPAPEEFAEETIELIRAYNWLDVELHQRYLGRIDPEAVTSEVVAENGQKPGAKTTQKRKRAAARSAAGGTGVPRPRKAPGANTDYGVLASRALARAQRVWDAADGQPSAEADFHLRQANVLATLELAQAFRARGGKSN